MLLYFMYLFLTNTSQRKKGMDNILLTFAFGNIFLLSYGYLFYITCIFKFNLNIHSFWSS